MRSCQVTASSLLRISSRCLTNASWNFSSVECPRSMCMSLSPLHPFLPLEFTLVSFYSDDWTKFTDYRGYEVNDEVIQWFWKCVRSWPPERKSRLLQFATGTSRIPVNGFKDLQGSDGPRRFTIEKAGDPNHLPKSHTCFNRIDLPPYKDYASLEHKLTLAVAWVLLSHALRRYLPLINVFL